MPEHKVFLVSSSHLDREWYFSFEKFRIIICHIIDKAAKLLINDPDFTCFMLDGQTVVLEDFLDVYPEKDGMVRELARKGKLILGPWYVQPDEFLPCGESHVRNLLIGRRIAGSYGGSMGIGYLPDSFGHISQMPQILNGFGIDKAFLMRGVERNSNKKFRWVSPDGSVVAALASDYGNCCRMDTGDMSKGISIIDNTEELINRIREIAARQDEANDDCGVLLMYCGDHCAPACNITETIKEINAMDEGYEIRMVSLEDCFSDIKVTNQHLETLEGELRQGEDIFILKDTMSSRMQLKIDNHHASRLLLYFAEPLCAIAWCEDMEYPQAFMEKSWRYLLQNHTHDGICGCSNDDVYEEMRVRFKKSVDISRTLGGNALKYLADRIDTGFIGELEKALVIFNPLYFIIDEALEFDVSFKSEDKPDYFLVFDKNGNEIPHQILEINEKERIESDLCVVQRFYREAVFRIVLRPGPIDSLGWKTLKIKPMYCGNKLFVSENTYKNGVVTGYNTMENEFLKISINNDGTFDLLDRDTGIIHKGLHYFEDSGDAGDVYSFKKPEFEEVYDSRNIKWDIIKLCDGPVMAKYRLQGVMKLPASLEPSKTTRSGKLADNELQYDIYLYAGSRYAGIRTEITNNSSDHRLRVFFTSGIKAGVSYAEGHYSIEKRGIGQFPDLHPQQTFVDVNDGINGFSVLNKGIPQYQVLDNGKCTIALTLLRCQDTLYRMFFKTFNEEFTGAQCHGKHIFEYAVYPHRGDWLEGKVIRTAHFFNYGITYALANKHIGCLPAEAGYIFLEPEDLVITAVKLSDDKCRLVVRFFNPTSGQVKGRLKVLKRIESACIIDLKEEFICNLPVLENYIPITVNPHKIISIALEIGLCPDKEPGIKQMKGC